MTTWNFESLVIVRADHELAVQAVAVYAPRRRGRRLQDPPPIHQARIVAAPAVGRGRPRPEAVCSTRCARRSTARRVVHAARGRGPHTSYEDGPDPSPPGGSCPTRSTPTCLPRRRGVGERRAAPASPDEVRRSYPGPAETSDMVRRGHHEPQPARNTRDRRARRRWLVATFRANRDLQVADGRGDIRPAAGARPCVSVLCNAGSRHICAVRAASGPRVDRNVLPRSLSPAAFIATDTQSGARGRSSRSAVATVRSRFARKRRDQPPPPARRSRVLPRWLRFVCRRNHGQKFSRARVTDRLDLVRRRRRGSALTHSSPSRVRTRGRAPVGQELPRTRVTVRLVRRVVTSARACVYDSRAVDSGRNGSSHTRSGRVVHDPTPVPQTILALLEWAADLERATCSGVCVHGHCLYRES